MAANLDSSKEKGKQWSKNYEEISHKTQFSMLLQNINWQPHHIKMF